MNETVLIGITLVVVLGIGAQWLSWRIKLPSILILLSFGFLAGPVASLIPADAAWLPEWLQHILANLDGEVLEGGGRRLVDPESLLGKLLFPVVSFSVAVILFEGGMTLKLAEVREIGRVIRNLILIGAAITWALVTAGAHIILQFELNLAVLLGAVLVVTGPTVVLPLLRHVQPVPQVRSVLKWEGILNDPVGAVLAVLVFEALFMEGGGSLTQHAFVGMLKTLVIGAGIGGISAWLLLVLFRNYWVPDFLQASVTFLAVVVAFAVSNVLQHESGLLTVTLMGIILANQKSVPVKHVLEFKENLRVLLISSLFILLAARLDFSALQEFNVRGLLFLLFLIFVVRPAAVFLPAMGSKLTTREKLFIAWMAPRGIVAAAVASVFALRLTDTGTAGAERLVPVTFLVIIGTITVYGLTAQFLARKLQVARPNPQGILFIGAHRWARAIAEALRDHGVEVMLVDTNRANIRLAKMGGLRTYYGSALTEASLEEMDLEGLGRLVALTPNEEANSLAILHFLEIFGRRELYQLAGEAVKEKDYAPAHLKGRVLFGETVSFAQLAERFFNGSIVKVTKLSADFDFDSVLKLYGETCLPLFLLGEKGEVEIFTADRALAPQAGQKIVCLVDDNLSSSAVATDDESPGGDIEPSAE